MRIVVLDGHTLNPGDNPWDDLDSMGEVSVFDRTPPDLTVERSRGADIILTNKTRLPAEFLAQLPELRFIAVLATGYDVVDIAAAKRHGIVVSNVPEYGTDSVAQHVMALLLELCQHVGAYDADVHAGAWQRSPDFCFVQHSPIELAGLTMGLVGYGRIGRRVGTLARAFGMNVVAAGDHNDASATDMPRLALGDLFTQSDVISLHCPLTPKNVAFVNEALLTRMRPTAFLINTARGGLIDEAALASALMRGTLAGAAVDVVSAEPMSEGNPLQRVPRCIITPHVAWASLAARRRLMATSMRNVRAYLDGKPIHTVNA